MSSNRYGIAGLSPESVLLVETFKIHGSNASFHYADDTGREWAQGNEFKREAMAVYHSADDVERAAFSTRFSR